jgi:hypothetical protein
VDQGSLGVPPRSWPLHLTGSALATGLRLPTALAGDVLAGVVRRPKSRDPARVLLEPQSTVQVRPERQPGSPTQVMVTVDALNDAQFAQVARIRSVRVAPCDYRLIRPSPLEGKVSHHSSRSRAADGGSIGASKNSARGGSIAVTTTCRTRRDFQLLSRSIASNIEEVLDRSSNRFIML